jgi:hypothetical protein
MGTAFQATDIETTKITSLDKVLYKWFTVKCSERKPVTGLMAMRNLQLFTMK